jgi:hypothetical protein
MTNPVALETLMEQLKQVTIGSPEWRLLVDAIRDIEVARYKRPGRKQWTKKPKLKAPQPQSTPSRVEDFLDGFQTDEAKTGS